MSADQGDGMGIPEHSLEQWLNAWVDCHDAGLDGTDDETLAVFAFIADLREWAASSTTPRGAVDPEVKRLREALRRIAERGRPGFPITPNELGELARDALALDEENADARETHTEREDGTT